MIKIQFIIKVNKDKEDEGWYQLGNFSWIFLETIWDTRLRWMVGLELEFQLQAVKVKPVVAFWNVSETRCRLQKYSDVVLNFLGLRSFRPQF